MTKQEHQLILEMFKRQTLRYVGLVELLQSRGIVEKGDLLAFDALISTTSRDAAEKNTKEDYVNVAHILGLPVKLDDLI